MYIVSPCFAPWFPKTSKGYSLSAICSTSAGEESLSKVLLLEVLLLFSIVCIKKYFPSATVKKTLLLANYK